MGETNIDTTTGIQTTIAYWSIAWASVKDGPGNRVVVYMQGCPARCPWCHSPHSQDKEAPLLMQKQLCCLCGACEKACTQGVHRIVGQEHLIDRSRCVGCGKCIENCPRSNKNSSNSALRLPTVRQSVSQLFELLRPQLDIVRSCGGITLSGGEALAQPEPAIELLRLCKENQIDTCVETSMLLQNAVYQKAARYVDHWLLGFREVYLPGAEEADMIRESCKRKLEILRGAQNTHLIARFPVIKGYTDTEEKLALLREVLLDNGVKELEILPCNRHMKYYYTLMGREVRLDVRQCIPEDEWIYKIMEYFRDSGIEVKRMNE